MVAGTSPDRVSSTWSAPSCAGAFELCFAARGDPHLGARSACRSGVPRSPHHRRCPRSARARLPARAHACAPSAMPSALPAGTRQPRWGQRRRVSRRTFVVGHDDVVGGSARNVFAEKPVLHAQRVLAAPAEVARAVADARIDDDLVAHRHSRDGGPDGLHDAARVGRNDPRRCERHTRKPAEYEQVEMIQRGRAHPNENVGGGADSRRRTDRRGPRVARARRAPRS